MVKSLCYRSSWLLKPELYVSRGYWSGTARLLPRHAVLWLMAGLLSLVGGLPCIIHCTGDAGSAELDDHPAGRVAWFLCDLPTASALPSSTTPHHHHVPSQAPSEPALALIGTISVVLLLAGRLVRHLWCPVRPLLPAPPTPPPRLVC